MIEEILNILNEWWTEEYISRSRIKPYRRYLFRDALRLLLNYKRMFILVGLRRVGKTTLLFQLIDELLKRGIEPKRVLYFSFDEKILKLVDILEAYRRLTGVNWKSEEIYLFLDEAYKLTNWHEELSMLFSSLPNLRIVCTSSAYVMLDGRISEVLADNFHVLELKALSLREFAEFYFGRKIEMPDIWREELEKLLPIYIKRPFPEVVKWDDRKVYEYIREQVVDRALKSDLPLLYHAKIRLLSRLFESFVQEPGMVINLTSLAKQLKVHKLTLEEHLRLLELTGLIKIVRNYRPELRAESRKIQKVYPRHIALSFPYYPSLTEREIFETLVSYAWDLTNYWRESAKEIEFIKREDLAPICMKTKSTVRSEDLKRLIYFMKRFNVKKGYFIYKGKREEIEVDGKVVELMPIIDLLMA